MTAAAFGQRRKMLRQSLRSLTPNPEALLAAAGIAPTLRAEALAVRDFARLAYVFERLGAGSSAPLAGRGSGERSERRSQPASTPCTKASRPDLALALQALGGEDGLQARRRLASRSALTMT